MMPVLVDLQAVHRLFNMSFSAQGMRVCLCTYGTPISVPAINFKTTHKLP